ncbi:PREDICTED: CPX chromosomal region candidate gene 1 protein [Miniopterus natalensis]|uniref:CPX chromosomal region candidate gene 1 protein n=1 Tax=Miniopterus natalensis TaxID=291302 RepID=UPI0007A6AD45|nr:PREDICTED: CPX chromosomal region candidate gene 1 protein [Miniopterus natalensis]
MSSPSKEESDPADNALKNSENEAPNDCSSDIEPSFVESNMVSQVDSNPMNRELDIPTSQDHAVQPAEENDLEVEKNQENPQEDLKEEEPLLIQIPIPRKWISLMSGLGRFTHLNTSLVKINKTNSLINRARFHSEKNQRKTSNICYVNINYKIPFQLSISWRMSFINRYERRRMVLRQLCERHLPQNTMWGKQKFVAFVVRPNVLNNRVRMTVFGRPMRVYYYYPLSERIALKIVSKSTDTKRRLEFHIFVRPTFDVPRTQFENRFTKRAFEDHLRSQHYIRVMIITTDNGWKYLCPICRSVFNSLAEFRQHSCNHLAN